MSFDLTRIKTTSFDSWRGFRDEILDWAGAGLGEAIFRGMRLAQWEPLTSLDRIAEELEVVDKRQLGRDLAGHFQANMSSEVRSRCTGIVDILAVGQHWGLPTPLLDWSTSPYIAAFFAFSGAVDLRGTDMNDSNVGIWRLDCSDEVFHSRAQSDDPNRSEIEVVRVGGVVEGRLERQRGLFTLNNGSRTLLEALEANGLLDRMQLFAIPATEERVALDDLESMTIDAAHLFPDLDGAAMDSIVRATRARRGNQ